MGMPVVTVAAGGMPVVEATFGTPVTEAANKYGVPVTKVIGKPGLPVVFETIGVAPAVTYATLNPATVAAVTLSDGNLVATNIGTTANEQGAKGVPAAGKTSGKYYFEATFTLLSGTSTRYVVGVAEQTATYTLVASASSVGAIVNSGGVGAANGAGGLFDLIVGSFSSGAVIGIAIDIDNRRGWFRQAPSGLWDNSATANPATNAEGLTIPAGTILPYCTFGGTGGTAGNVTTMNFGASAFVGAVPAGFTAGWPA